MESGLTTEQVIGVTVEAEQNAAAFYEKCADAYPEHRDMFEALSGAEKKHADMFGLMATGGSGTVDRRPADAERVHIFHVLVEMAGTEGGLSEELLTDETTPIEVLAHAIDAEKNAVLLYSGLKNLVTEDALGTLNAIIEEEMGHVAMLYRVAKEW